MFVKKVVSNLLKSETVLKNEPVIVYVNKFNEEAAKKFSEDMGKAQLTGQPVIPVVIDSYGGAVYSLTSMVSTIKASEVPVATIVLGKAMSCGTALASCGAEGMRFCSPDATYLIHDVSSWAVGKIEEMKVSTKEAKRLDKMLYTMMSRNCGQKDDYFKKLSRKKRGADWFFTPKEAKKHNLANHICIPKMTVSVDVNFEFHNCDEDK
jgi:ATP-dependent Clp protease, protease subunit